MSQNGKSLSEQISKILAYLKSKKITQSEVEDILNYTSLSKAKNFEKYPQSVIEKKTRQELISQLLSTFNLSYNIETDEVSEGNATPVEKVSMDNSMTYIMYYYAFARETIGKAIIRIFNHRKVTIEYPMNEYWEGDYEVIENYTFITAIKKGDTTPVKKLICLFSGTEKHGRPLLMGSYSTVKRDGYPAAGSLILELITRKNDIDNRLKSDVDPRIMYFLKDSVIVTNTYTPNTLDNLNKDFKLIKRYSDQYKIYYSRKGKLQEGMLELFQNGNATILMASITYEGKFRLLDSHTIKVILKDTSDFSLSVREEIDLIIRTNSTVHSPFYSGSGLSNLFDQTSFNFEFLLLSISMVKDKTYNKAEKILSSAEDK